MASKKESNGRPQISNVSPEAAIPGGELQIRGAGLARAELPRVTIGDVDAPIVIGSDSYVIVRVPEGASAGELVVAAGNQSSRAWTCDIGIQIADNLHPVGNPAVDTFGNIYATFSGSRGQKTPVSVYKIDLNYAPKPFASEIMNATGLAFDKDGTLYVFRGGEGAV
jgi:IPT/TIG domain